MLGKLIKYEFKGTARLYLPFFALLVLLTVVNRFSLQFSVSHSEIMEIPSVLAMMLYIVAVIAIFVIAMVATVQRFYKNFMTDEGYLMFTLPVSDQPVFCLRHNASDHVGRPGRRDLADLRGGCDRLHQFPPQADFGPRCLSGL